jgi:uncharacterized protein involved in response to NO
MTKQSTLAELRRNFFAAAAVLAVVMVGAWVIDETVGSARGHLVGHARLATKEK